MPLDEVARRADELATMVGPIETLLAMARLEDALEVLDSALESSEESPGPDAAAIDLREFRSLMERIQPVLDRAEVRVDSLRSALNSPS